MTRDVPRWTAGVMLAAVLLAIAGCSHDRVESGPAATPSTPTLAGPVTPASPSSPPTPVATASTTPGVPGPGSMDQPATSSGPLSKASFPTPDQLGPGWRYAVDPGSAEEGYAGNGTPSLARSPREIVQTAVPFGCAREAAMPAPRHALEVDYMLRGAKVIAVRGQFADRAQASTFFTGRERNLRACSGRSGGAAIGLLVGAVSRPAGDALASDRTPRSDPWREVSVLDGDTVVLLAVQGSDMLSDAATRRLVRQLRS